MKPPAPAARLLLTTDAVGGVWVFASSLSLALAARGWQVTIVTLGPAPRPEQLNALRKRPEVSVLVTDLALEWQDPDGRDEARAHDLLSSIARRVRPDVVHLNGYREAGARWNAPVLLTAHSCVRSWWRACNGGEPPAQPWSCYVTGVRSALAAADRWVAPTRAFRDEMQRLYAPARGGDVIWNGTAEGADEAHKEPFILAAGRLWDEAKNLATLAAAAPSVPWPVRVAGPLRQNSPAPSAIESLGELEHGAVLAEMASAAIFAAPALYEPFGLGILEAAARGCALVLADIPTLRELWADAALFCPPRDERALAGALTRVCSDAALRVLLQQKARHRSRRYAVAAQCKGYSQLYEALLGVSPASPSRRISVGDSAGAPA